MKPNQHEMNPQIPRQEAVGNPRLWCTKYRVSPRAHTEPYLFEREIETFMGIRRQVPLNYLTDIYNTLLRLKRLRLAIIKGRQARISEFTANSVFYLSDTHQGIRTLYILQDKPNAEKFVKERINTPIEDSLYLGQIISEAKDANQKRRREINSLSTKRMGRSWFHMVYSTGWGLSRSPSCDGVIFDEYDAHDHEEEESFLSVIDDSDIKFEIYVSTPTLPDYGIDLVFKSSSMGRWTVNCPHCLEDFIMNSDYFFGKGIVKFDEPRPEDGAMRIYVCPNCETEITNWDKQERGRYVHEIPELLKENKPGFSFSNLILPHIDADTAWDQYQTALRRPGGRKKYINEKLGEACIDEEATAHINRQMMVDCIDDTIGWVEAANRCYVGVDWGRETHVTIYKDVLREKGKHLQLLNYFVIPASSEPLHGAKEVAKLLVQFQPSKLVCDFGAGAEQNKYLATRFGDSFYAAIQANTLKDMNPKWNPKTQTVNYDVVTTYATYCHWFGAGLVILPRYDGKLELFIQHHCNSMLIDQNKHAVIEREIDYLHAVDKALPKQLGQKGPIHLLSSSMFAFMDFMGHSVEEFSFSELPKDIEMMVGRDSKRPFRFTMDKIDRLVPSHDETEKLYGAGVSYWRP